MRVYNPPQSGGQCLEFREFGAHLIQQLRLSLEFAVIFFCVCSCVAKSCHQRLPGLLFVTNLRTCSNCWCLPVNCSSSTCHVAQLAYVRTLAGGCKSATCSACQLCCVSADKLLLSALQSLNAVLQKAAWRSPRTPSR
jgi:hypothetical protein